MIAEIPSTDAVARCLVVDDDRLLAELITEWVEEKWACETVLGGSDAVAEVDGRFDVVLLDRQMPDMSGEEVLEVIRENDLPVQVVMVSSVEPDFDILDLPIDDYLQKPVDRPTLQRTIEGLLLRRTYHPTIERFFVCAAKLDVLEEVKFPSELAGDERYTSLRAKADELRQAADATLGSMSGHVARVHEVELDD